MPFCQELIYINVFKISCCYLKIKTELKDEKYKISLNLINFV